MYFMLAKEEDLLEDQRRLPALEAALRNDNTFARFNATATGTHVYKKGSHEHDGYWASIDELYEQALQSQSGVSRGPSVLYYNDKKYFYYLIHNNATSSVLRKYKKGHGIASREVVKVTLENKRSNVIGSLGIGKKQWKVTHLESIAGGVTNELIDRPRNYSFNGSCSGVCTSVKDLDLRN
jgi:hypothetical protein